MYESKNDVYKRQRLRREAVRHEHKAVRHILKRDLRFVLRIFAVLLEIGVDGGDEPAARGLVRRAAVLEARGVAVSDTHLLRTAYTRGRYTG